MDRFLDRVVIEPFDRFLEKILRFFPEVLSALLILLAGLFFAGVLRVLLHRLFRAVRLDNLADKSGMTRVLARGGIRDPFSLLLARVIAWFTLACFVIVALYSLSVPAVEQVLSRLLLYLPNIFAAALILLFGYLLSNFLGQAALIAGVNAGLRASRLLARFVRLTIFLLSATMALEQLGIGRETILIAFTLVFGGIVLALAIAFGFGGQELARRYLEEKARGEKDEDDVSHL